ncbi:type I restriction enzyme subunit R domain-containing protein [Campylobacter vicugnae]|uniref:type I restriction enzyme subunit R domain-containing protein n=1 Tax=Campylobacter vicugnae TaxID=1660076 RepID=UPI003F6B34F6
MLFVANKYQTSFDQKKLCAMYVIKKLRDISAVQILSRLNRAHKLYSKKRILLYLNFAKRQY